MFEIGGPLALSLMENAIPLPATMERGYTNVAPWIAICVVVVPNRPSEEHHSGDRFPAGTCLPRKFSLRQAQRRFVQEAQAIASLRSPHTVTIWDFGQSIAISTSNAIISALGKRTDFVKVFDFGSVKALASPDRVQFVDARAADGADALRVVRSRGFGSRSQRRSPGTTKSNRTAGAKRA